MEITSAFLDLGNYKECFLKERALTKYLMLSAFLNPPILKKNS